jgi:hypothetical protein
MWLRLDMAWLRASCAVLGRELRTGNTQIKTALLTKYLLQIYHGPGDLKINTHDMLTCPRRRVIHAIASRRCPLAHIEETTMKYGTIGTISHATLRTEDLLEAFASELEYQVQRNAAEWCSDKGRKQRDAYLKLVAEAEEIDVDSDDACELVNELSDALEDFAPPYCYFGNTEGDGSDFGFWPSRETIEELPRVNDSDEARALGEDCAFVNDHGNVTVYSGDGSVILELV